MATLASSAAVARAETPPAAVERDAQLPVLVHFVEAEYPEASLRSGVEAEVPLELTLSAEGAVTRVEVLESRGTDFEHAARTAALGFRFEPARRNGVAVACRIRYKYGFRLPAPAPSDAATPATSPTSTAEAPTAVAAPADSGAVTPRAPAARSTQPSAAPDTMEVTVRGVSPAERLRQSAESVRVVELRSAAKESSDLGEVLNRSAGVSVRSAGGLGSVTNISLNGLRDDQIRVTVDELPLTFAGYGPNLASVPVNLMARVETYRGVVPIRFGADALGGLVNLVSAAGNGAPRAGAALQVGSFGTYRLSAFARARLPLSGSVFSLDGFLDDAKNRYPIQVEVAGRDGRLHRVTTRRFHDAYRAGGLNTEFTLRDRPWAKRVSVRLFASGLEKQIQNNLAMTTPYGEVRYDEQSYGGSVRYETPTHERYGASMLLGYAQRRLNFSDQSPWVYDWFGSRIRERERPGEIDSDPSDASVWDKNWLGRLTAFYAFSTTQELRVSSNAAHVKRTGTERANTVPGGRDPLAGSRRLLTLVQALELHSQFLDDALENSIFAKHYFYSAESQESLPDGGFQPLSSGTQVFGGGDAMRYRLNDWLLVKAAYEFATRMPRTDEMFGDSVLIRANLRLKPERSHNLNLGAEFERVSSAFGRWRAELYGFLRAARDQIEPLGVLDLTYQNVYGARALGVEAVVRWVAPRGWLELDGNLTWMDLRNVGSSGAFAEFRGDRIPHRPWLFGNAGAKVRVPGLRDELSASWFAHYTHGFYRTWESLGGATELKDRIPAQLVQTLVLSWVVQRALKTSASFEVQNLTNTAAYDYFGVQKPGRAVFFKGTFEY